MKQAARTVLIVEDEISLRMALKIKLSKEGYIALEAKNGQEGLEVALAKHPDLILLDMIMPVMDGMTMLQRLRKDVWGKKANVIVLTNLSDSNKAILAAENGTYDYLIKSDWKIEDLIKKIEECLKR